MKFRLNRVRLDWGGYDYYGAYWGHGPPLWRFEATQGPECGMVRAKDREAAKAAVQKLYPKAEFFK